MSNNRKYAPDFGKISLWIDSRETTDTACTGKVHILDENGEVIKEVLVFIYRNESKQSERSPDYYGWLKQAAPVDSREQKSKGLSPVKPVKRVEYDEEEEEEVAF